ncbi:hypothetical protein SJAV_26710 [Sulfurisphaera javensis]|uniref:Uncharacterized protein n=1 Tax=Sulfurisphaera javensis TaxID=2049879 RepID=A0AAT9GV15_9CREN
MISFEEFRASGYINCFKKYLKTWDEVSIQSLSYLISYLSDDEIKDLSMFKYSDDGVVYEGKPENVDGNLCVKYLDKVKDLDPKLIRELSKKLFNYTLGEKVDFSPEEREIMKKLSHSKS